LNTGTLEVAWNGFRRDIFIQRTIVFLRPYIATLSFRFGPSALFGIAISSARAAEQPQLPHDDFGHGPPVTISVVVLSRLQAPFHEDKLSPRHKLAGNFTQLVPANATKPFDAISLLAIAGLERFIDGE
jgi:hypothetical protein